ncbi:MAG: hypothetical protein ACI31O_05320 [Limosilactobacillus vaginalis]|uniref:hypothetical protein n=1 Tax=Limosilactobacillus vaginalis TaxID=1633 RepID=UPI003F02FC41
MKNNKEKSIKRVLKQKQHVLDKYGNLTIDELNNLCTYLNIKTDSAKVWIGAGVALLIAIFFNHGDALYNFLYDVLKFVSAGHLKGKILREYAKQATLYTKWAVSLIFILLTYVAYSHQKNLNWLLQIKEERIKAEQNQLEEKRKKLRAKEIHDRMDYLVKLRQRRRLK